MAKQALDHPPLPFALLEEVKREVVAAFKGQVDGLTEKVASLIQAQPLPEEQVLRDLEKGAEVELVEPRELSANDAVLVKTVNGSWQKATVSEIGVGSVLIRREDGSTRKVTPAMLVKSTPDLTGQVIRLERFGVTIFEGTKSWEVEKKLEPITEKMNDHPLMVDQATWQKALDQHTTELAEALIPCLALTYGSFNPGSGPQVAAALEARGKILTKKSPKGGVSVDQGVLQEFVDEGDELAKHVMVYREARTKLSQLESWEPFAKAGQVQAIWDQYGTPHGRYTADSPNLQNRIVPIRETVVARPGFSFVSVDWGMAEYVTWASLSKDPVLSGIFLHGNDLHKAMGEDLTAINPRLLERGDTERKLGKTMNFAILYRMLAFTLAKKLNISVVEATELIQFYKGRAAVATQYMEDLLKKAASDGFVETYLGRRLDCPTLGSLRGPRLHALQKTVWHHHNAGTAAELLKLKMINVSRDLAKANLPNDVALNMHDEIIFEVPDAQATDVGALATESMMKPVGSFLPFSVDCRIGKSWGAISK